jgi:hypothetical protein
MSVNDELGLIEGFDLPPAVMMPYNPPHYRDLLEGFGCQPAMTLFAYSADDQDGQIPERLARGVELAKRRYRCFVRGIDMRRLRRGTRLARRLRSGVGRQLPCRSPHAKSIISCRHCAWSRPDLCLLAESKTRRGIRLARQTRPSGLDGTLSHSACSPSGTGARSVAHG